MYTSAFPLVQSENDQLALRFQDTESSLRRELIAKEGDAQSHLATIEKDKAALIEKNKQLSAELAATREELQAVQAGLQVLLNAFLLPTNGSAVCAGLGPR